MTALLVIDLDRDTAGHLAVAMRWYRGRLAELGHAEPPGLADLETVAQRVYKRHEQSRGFTVPNGLDHDLHAPDFLSRADISHTTGVSLSTVDRWVRSGALPSAKHGRTRRVSRQALDQFLTAT